MVSIFLTLALSLATTKAAGVQWPLSYANKSANEFIWDKRTEKLVRATLPRKFVDDFIGGLDGPADPVYVDDGRYVSTSACVPHACLSKSFYWYDTRSGVALGASLEAWDSTPKRLVLSSRAISPDQIPAPAFGALKRWLRDLAIRPEIVSFVDSSEKLVDLPIAKFQARMGFIPPPGGPSFDCNKARSTTERIICGDPILATKDLELSQLVAELRRGTPSTKDRDQLLELQRSWLHSRDQCPAEYGAVMTCLYNSYDAQNQVLMNWKPKR